jgi:hypothetical protein
VADEEEYLKTANVWSRRARAAYAAYSEAMMAELREEKPGLKQSQYKDMIWKAWQKAPENPLNRAAAGGG